MMYCEQMSGCSSKLHQAAQSLFPSRVKRVGSVDIVPRKGLERFLLLKAQVIHCGSLRMDVCLATWQTEIHGGIAVWDTQSGEPSAELLPVDNPLQHALRPKTCEKSLAKHLVPKSHSTHSWLCRKCFCPNQKQDSKTRLRSWNETSWERNHSLCWWIHAF
jgi:hypothetical protein